MKKEQNFYAHSGVSKKNILPQRLENHIMGVYNFCKIKSKEINLSKELTSVLLIAALFHDFGKLDDSCQKILSKNDKTIYSDGSEKMINHVDAGVCFLINKYLETKNKIFLHSAALIKAHHIGLENQNKLFSYSKNSIVGILEEYTINENFRDNKIKDIIDSKMNQYYKSFQKIIPIDLESILNKESAGICYPSSVDMRMLLSILVDADFTDTANHSRGIKKPYIQKNIYHLKYIKRLNKYVKSLERKAKNKNIAEDRINIRKDLYKKSSYIYNEKIYLCDGTVGSGKTLSMFSLALNLCKRNNLERIYTIIPFINVIQQTCKEYSNIVKNTKNHLFLNEIHSKVEFSNKYKSYLSNQWNSHVNVSTAFQFIHALLSNKPACIRKLHFFANSVIILDEYHTMMAPDYWKIFMYFVKEMSEKYNTYFIFGSGSPVKYWEITEDIKLEVCHIINEDEYEKMIEKEQQRVEIKRIEEPFDSIQKTIDFIYEKYTAKNGRSILSIYNTVKNAITIFRSLKDEKKVKEGNIYLLTSYLSPKDREIILEKIKYKLNNTNEKIILIATSLVGCGIDFSRFDDGIIEETGLLQILQYIGRVNRNSDNHDSCAYIIRFDDKLFKEKILSRNPSFIKEINKTRERDLNSITPEYCTDYVESLIDVSEMNRLYDKENRKEYEDIGKESYIIQTQQISVIVDSEISRKVRDEEDLLPSDITNNAVNVYRSKLKDESFSKYLSKIEDEEDVYEWIGDYDSEFFGIGSQLYL